MSSELESDVELRPKHWGQDAGVQSGVLNTAPTPTLTNMFLIYFCGLQKVAHRTKVGLCIFNASVIFGKRKTEINHSTVF